MTKEHPEGKESRIPVESEMKCEWCKGEISNNEEWEFRRLSKEWMYWRRTRRGDWEWVNTCEVCSKLGPHARQITANEMLKQVLALFMGPDPGS